MQNLKIETARLVLRPFTESDATAASYNSKQPSVAHFMPEMVKDTEEAALGWIRHVNKELWSIDKPCVLFAIVRKADEQCIRCIFINRKEEWGNIVEMGYYIGDEYQNGGYATEAGKAMIWWAFEKAG
jgi:RimJ/RimL family protein N-acetyltransferase